MSVDVKKVRTRAGELRVGDRLIGVAAHGVVEGVNGRTNRGMVRITIVDGDDVSVLTLHRLQSVEALRPYSFADDVDASVIAALILDPEFVHPSYRDMAVWILTGCCMTRGRVVGVTRAPVTYRAVAFDVLTDVTQQIVHCLPTQVYWSEEEATQGMEEL